MVLICHADDPVDSEGIAAWLACNFALAGIVLLRDEPGAWRHKLRREYRRVGGLRLLDVILFRLFYRLTRARQDAGWVRDTVRDLRRRFPADLSGIPRLVAHDPNDPAVREFMAGLQPDLALARCKHILQPAIFTIPRYGTWVLHPGICPMYRNAHGCFWALANRDLANVGMTLLKIDAGIDTGPIYLQQGCDFDEARESHVVIQHRVVLDNLDAITGVLHAIGTGTASPVTMPPDQRSVNWGQPWLTAYLRWKRGARGASP